MNKIAIVFGVTGQIGSYLVEHLLNHPSKEYSIVVGVARRVSNSNTERLTEVLNDKRFVLMGGDITDSFSLNTIFNKVILEKNSRYEIYNLAAASHVHTSFSQPRLYNDITGFGHVNVLEAARQFHDKGHKLHVYFQASSEIFGSQISENNYQTSATRFWPNSPYAASKLYAYHMNRIYRESYGLKASSGIIFNTESPRRGEDFVTRKITKWFSKFAADGYKFNGPLELGNINSCRDWTHAIDSVRAITMIAASECPKDYLVASGETHSIKNFLEECYEVMESKRGKCPIALENLYTINPDFFRPNEVPYLRGLASEIYNDFGWKPTISFKKLVREMFISDYFKHQHTND